MALRLHLVSKQAADLGEAATAIFGVHGGRLGRAMDNDWPLPDENRYLSAHHAHLVHQAGNWSVIDTSSNGVWYNRERDPIGRGNTRKLAHGDRLRFGDYVAMVSIVADNDFPLEKDLLGRAPDALAKDLASSTENHLGANFDIHSLLEGSGMFARPSTPVTNAPRRAPSLLVPGASRPPVELQHDEPPLPPANPAPPPTTSQIAFRARLAEPTLLPTPAPDPVASTTAIAALGRGLGVDLSQIPAARQAELLATAGQLIRELTLGLMGQLRAERQRAEGLGATPELTARNPNPLEALESTDEALRRLLVEPAQRFMGPVDAVRDAYQDLQTTQGHHEAAVVAGMNHLLAQLAPAELAARFDRSLGPQGLAGDTSRYWALYPDLHRAITQRRRDGVPYAFTEGYGNARDAAAMEAEQATGAATDVNESTAMRKSGLAG
jgi:type VI secretion system protein